MNSFKTKGRIFTSAAIAASLALGAGCTTSRHQAAAPISYNENAESMGGMGEASETQTGGGESLNNANEVVVPLEREQASVGTQDVNNGAVRIRKTVRTQTVTEPVQIRQETVTVDRVPAGSAQQTGSATTALNTPFQGGEITIPLTKEQPVVQTQVVPNGSIVIHKHETTTPMNVQAQVRSEEATAEPVGNPQNVNISGNLRGSEESNQAQATTPPPQNEAVGGTSSQYGQTGGAGVSSEPINQWSQLNSPDAASLAGRTVNLSNVKVQRVVNDQLVQVQGENGSPLYVRLTQPNQGLQPGQTVTLHGTVQAVPSDTSTLGWDPSSTQALQGQQIYITVGSLQ